MFDSFARLWHNLWTWTRQVLVGLRTTLRHGLCRHKEENLVRRFQDGKIFAECACGWQSPGWFCPDRVYVGRSRVGQ